MGSGGGRRRRGGECDRQAGGRQEQWTALEVLRLKTVRESCPSLLAVWLSGRWWLGSTSRTFRGSRCVGRQGRDETKPGADPLNLASADRRATLDLPLTDRLAELRRGR